MSKKIALLGSTGSIGVQSLDVVRAQGYEVTALAAGNNVELLAKQVAEFRPELVALRDETQREKLEHLLLPYSGCRVITGKDAAHIVAQECDADIVLNAIVGIAGLDATLAAAQRGLFIALANKESLVAGGQLVVDTVRQNEGMLLPVDSEHSAIFQCLQDLNSAKALQKVILTASGGPFYGKKRDELTRITKEDALKHPNWDMGAKITIDSASLMNKGLELIEAMWLFDLPPEDIDIVVQRESVIHSMVQFDDHSILAQLGVPDMRIPIQYALTWPMRLSGPAPVLDFSTLTSLSIGQADPETFRCLAACQKAAAKAGLAPCAANGANEEAVGLFLQDEIDFLEIGRLVEACVDKDSYAGGYTLEDVYECDRMARVFVQENKRLRAF